MRMISDVLEVATLIGDGHRDCARIRASFRIWFGALGKKQGDELRMLTRSLLEVIGGRARSKRTGNSKLMVGVGLLLRFYRF